MPTSGYAVAKRICFPGWVRCLPMRDVSVPVLLATLCKIEVRGALQMGNDLRQSASHVFIYGIQTGKCESNLVVNLIGAFKKHTVKHMAAVLTPVKAGELMRGISGNQGMPAIRTALLLSALLFQRPGNIRAFEWTWVDLVGCLVTIPAEAMKRAKSGKVNGWPHLVHLAQQAIEAFRELHPLADHRCDVFPSIRTRGKPMNENTLNGALDLQQRPYFLSRLRARLGAVLKILGSDSEAVSSFDLGRMTDPRHTFTDEQWQRIEPSMPPCKGRPGGAHRRFFDALLWMARTGSPWRDLPERQGAWNVVHQRDACWCKKSHVERLFQGV